MTAQHLRFILIHYNWVYTAQFLVSPKLMIGTIKVGT